MATLTLDATNFESVMTKDGIVLIDFWAPWCGPCRMFGPTFEKSSDAHPDVTFAKLDTQANQEVAGALNIQSIPTLMILRDGVLLYRQAGALPAPALEQLITQAKSLDMEKVKAEVEKERARA